MKKLLLSVFALALCSAVNAQCNELFISEYVEGTGYDKALELYNPTNTAINLSGYRLERFSNGSATSVSGGVLNLAGTIAAHSAFVITNNNTTAPPTSPTLTAMADQLDNPYPAPTYMNGNDAIVLYNNASIIDILGKTGDAAMVTANGWSDVFPYDGSAGAIWTENHTLVRKASVTQGVTVDPSPEFIVTAEWDSLPVNTFTGLGTHTCSCPTGINEIDNTVSVLVYPNPSNLEYVNVSTSEAIISAHVFNTIGQEVIVKEGNKNDKTMIIETAKLPKGVYIVKMLFEKGKSTVVKLSIQ
ncbi:MAG: lamin tail domain-containing protein [Bacteroidetes bacterium]|nr:lamin tail domain-containing protein [Bacteroidota bacterium]